MILHQITEEWLWCDPKKRHIYKLAQEENLEAQKWPL